MNFYRSCKNEIVSHLRKMGFVRDSLGEGAVKKVDAERMLVVIVTGMWSHVEVKIGIRFNSVNNSLLSIAKDSGWSEEEFSVFLLDQTTLFWKSLGDYCENESGVGLYCPANSEILDVNGIIQRVVFLVEELEAISGVRDAVNFFRERGACDPYNVMMLGASVLLNDREMFNWAKELPKGDLYLFEESKLASLADECERRL